MEKFTAAQLEQFLDIKTEIICSLEHHQRLEEGQAMNLAAITTVTSTRTTTGRF